MRPDRFNVKLYVVADYFLETEAARLSRLFLGQEGLTRRIMANDTERLKWTFIDEQAYNSWLDCGLAAHKCCKEVQRYAVKPGDKPLTDAYAKNSSLTAPNTRDVCLATWDGWSCWANSPAGHIVDQQCPEYVYSGELRAICRGTVTKQCKSDGTWFERAADLHEWTDYHDCGASIVSNSNAAAVAVFKVAV